MIIVKIQGGVGNQMFQWACGSSLAETNKTDLYLETTSYRYDAKRKFKLSGFNNIQKKLNSSVEILDGWVPRNINMVVDDFKTFDFPEGDLFLNGYWQSERYFSFNKEQIKSDFDLSEYSEVLSDFPELENSVSLHVRRTDYLASNGYHPVQDLNYYTGALELLNKDYEKIFIFSDDIDWCKQNIKFDNLVFIDNTDEFESLCLMSNTRHNITANSSFSWWAAWLNKNKDKKVICPKLWFGDITNLSTENIVPETWISI